MLEAAARLFGTQRFHEVRMEDIAAEAAVGKGTLYRYFQDKEELYAALLDRASRRSANACGRNWPGPGSPKPPADARGNRHGLLRRAAAPVRPDPAFGGAAGPGLRLAAGARRDFAAGAGVFREGQEQGEFRIGDPELASLLLLGGMRSVHRFGSRPRPADLGSGSWTGCCGVRRRWSELVLCPPTFCAIDGERRGASPPVADPEQIPHSMSSLKSSSGASKSGPCKAPCRPGVPACEVPGWAVGRPDFDLRDDSPILDELHRLAGLQAVNQVRQRRLCFVNADGGHDDLLVR